MTDFNGVKRRTLDAYSVLYSKPRKIVVSLERNDQIVFRESGRRQTWCLPAEAAFRYAVRLAALAAQREKRSRKDK